MNAPAHVAVAVCAAVMTCEHKDGHATRMLTLDDAVCALEGVTDEAFEVFREMKSAGATCAMSCSSVSWSLNENMSVTFEAWRASCTCISVTFEVLHSKPGVLHARAFLDITGARKQSACV